MEVNESQEISLAKPNESSIESSPKVKENLERSFESKVTSHMPKPSNKDALKEYKTKYTTELMNFIQEQNHKNQGKIRGFIEMSIYASLVWSLIIIL